MRDPIILLVHLIATLARLMGPGGLRSVVAESVLVKQQLLILNRSRHRAPNLCASDRILAGVCALFMRPARVIRSAIVLRPSTILEFHRALRTRKYRWLFSPKRRRTGPQGPALVHESELARNDPHPEAPHLPISDDSGPPRSVIRFRMLHASSASALCPPGVRARRPVPMIDLYLKKAFSTRACRW